jgi:rRNA maturation endonuclease Nob1
MPTGIEPEFCPSCGGQVEKVAVLARDDPDATGYYEEDEV